MSFFLKLSLDETTPASDKAYIKKYSHKTLFLIQATAQCFDNEK
ncbi:MAG TPA: hypothetical protein VJ697_15010 [Nitrososphaeraceae archaeon]|nr:hypothetical protein [Nitrososphaeraceae archaeon]